MLQSSSKHPSLYIAAGFFALCLGVIAISWLAPSALRRIAGEKTSTSLGREVSIGEPVKIEWNWSKPKVHIGQLRIANMPQSTDPTMVDVEAIDFHIKIWKLLEGQLNIPDITISKPILILEKFDKTTNNWNFPALSKANTMTHAALPTHRGNFPIIGTLAVTNGKLVYRDKTANLDLTLGIDTANGGGGEKENFTLTGQGSFQNKVFALNAQGGSLDMLRNSQEKYPLHLHIQMADTIADIDGTFEDPINLKGINTKMDIQGDSMANLFYLTLIPLPPTSSYKLSGQLLKKGDLWTFDNFAGKVGNSDLEGHLTYDTSSDRGFMKADLTSNLLDMKDLAGFLGATPTPAPQEKASPEQIVKAQQEKASPKLLPDVPIDLTRLRTTDLDVTLNAKKVMAPSLPMNDMHVRFDLRDGVLRLDPLEFGMADGKISGSLIVDGTHPVPRVQSDLVISRLSLKEFFAGTPYAPLSTGFIGGRFELIGHGKSLAEVLGDSNGEVTFVMSGGTISELLVDAVGLDIGNAAPILLGKDKATTIRCAVADFGVDKGFLQSKIFVFDTTQSNISGSAHIDLKSENIDAKIEAEPKNPSVTAHAPIIVTGALKHPTIGLDLKEATGRAAGATLLSVFLTPIAAIIPFIETGVGKDSDCRALMSEAEAASPPPP